MTIVLLPCQICGVILSPLVRFCSESFLCLSVFSPRFVSISTASVTRDIYIDRRVVTSQSKVPTMVSYFCTCTVGLLFVPFVYTFVTLLEMIPCWTLCWRWTGSESRSSWSKVQSSTLTDCACMCMANPLDVTVLNRTESFVIVCLGCLASLSDSTTVTPNFFLLISKRNVSGRFWRFWKKILVTVFLLQRFGAVNPGT